MRNILSQLLINELDQLTSSVLHGNLHYNGVLEQLNMTKREKILKQHPYAIYLTDNGTAWRTYLPATEEHGYRKPVRSITPVDIDDFYLAVTKDLQYTKKTVSNARGILNSIMNYYVKRGIIPQNPARDISLRCSKPIRKK